MRQTQTFSKPPYCKGGPPVTTDAYTDDGKVWFWSSVDRPVPLDAAQEYGIPVDPAAQQAAVSAHADRVIAAYREAMTGRRPTEEEQFEMRAAFGPGQTVVDIITGDRFTT